jgi:hypothetical protein
VNKQLRHHKINPRLVTIVHKTTDVIYILHCLKLPLRAHLLCLVPWEINI